MPIRNPFKKAPTAQDLFEQNNRDRRSTDTGFEDANLKGAKPIEIKEPTEYKLSEVNDNGDFVPPSPPAKEKSSFFSRTSTSSTQNSALRSALSDNEPFNISRESFDSYRRSFDISARSPIAVYDTPNRGSLDSRRQLNAYSPRPSFQERGRRAFQPAREEPEFEDVGLNDEVKPQQKKRGFLGRFGDTSTEPKVEQKPHSFLSGITSGRRRGQSGGNELKSMPDHQDNRPAAVAQEVN